ncbi:MAG: response regulator [Nitrospiraceae bacterium]|nr:MAG: response regulator [Nitrospiraceae bacterium]
MPGGGSLTIETDIREMDSQFVRAHGFGSPGTYAFLSVTDTGEGISEDIRQKVFEPFFTTKEVGRGTGLGLSIVYGIITQHNGYINIYSEPGEGTSFNIYLPEIKTAIPLEKASPAITSSGKAETILIVEDEAEVRGSIRSVLEESGYRVLEAVDGMDAVDQFVRHADSIALIIMDVIMPRMNGREAFKEIRKIRPEAKAIFTSGYTADVIRTKKIHDEALVFVSKPIFPDRLLSKIRDVLEG